MGKTFELYTNIVGCGQSVSDLIPVVRLRDILLAILFLSGKSKKSPKTYCMAVGFVL